MKFRLILLFAALLPAGSILHAETEYHPATLQGREFRLLQFQAGPEYGRKKPQTEHIGIQFPNKTLPADSKAPVIVILNDFDVFCGNARSHLAPDDFFLLMIGGAYQGCTPGYEKLVMDIIAWFLKTHPGDPDRIYLLANAGKASNAALQIAFSHGDRFAAVRVSTPDRFVKIAEKIMRGKKEFPFFCGYFNKKSKAASEITAFHALLRKHAVPCALFAGPAGMNAFGADQLHWYCFVKDPAVLAYSQWLQIRKSAPRPVFSDTPAFPAAPADKFERLHAFRVWKNIADTENEFSMEFSLAPLPVTRGKPVAAPESEITSVTFQRIRAFRPKAETPLVWTFGSQSGIVNAEKDGSFVIPALKLTGKPSILKVIRKK